MVTIVVFTQMQIERKMSQMGIILTLSFWEVKIRMSFIYDERIIPCVTCFSLELLSFETFTSNWFWSHKFRVLVYFKLQNLPEMSRIAKTWNLALFTIHIHLPSTYPVFQKIWVLLKSATCLFLQNFKTIIMRTIAKFG